MAITIEPKLDKYIDLPLTDFPVKEDTRKRMMDVNSVLMPVVKQYNIYFADGNLAACNDLLKNNPDIQDCIFNADKWNWSRDAIIAIQRFFLEEVVTFINNVAQNALGVNDNPTDEQLLTTSYSTGYINTVIDIINTQLSKIQNSTIITLLASDWSDSAPYSQRIAVPGLQATDEPGVYPWTPKTLTADATKIQRKMAALITAGETEDGYITLYCGYKKPTVDFQIILKGVSI